MSHYNNLHDQEQRQADLGGSFDPARADDSRCSAGASNGDLSERSQAPTIGFKLTDCHSGKGVICHIAEPHEMPIFGATEPVLYQTDTQPVVVETQADGTPIAVSVSQAMLEQDQAQGRLIPQIAGTLKVYGEEPILVCRQPNHGWCVHWQAPPEGKMAWVPLARLPRLTLAMVALHLANTELYPHEVRAWTAALLQGAAQGVTRAAPPRLSKTQAKRARRTKGWKAS